MTRRVVITGLGTVNPLGVGVPGFWHGLVNGKNGIGPINLFDAAAFKVRFAGLVREWEPDAAAPFQECAPVPHQVQGQGVHRAHAGDDDATGHFLAISRSM